MIAELQKILTLPPVNAVLYRDLSIEKFTDEINFTIHNLGEDGYDAAERMNLKTSDRYTIQEAQELLYEIKESQRATETKIEPLSGIPYGLVKSLISESFGPAGLVGQIRECGINYGAIKGYELTGFVSAMPWRNQVSIVGLYVNKSNRGKGISLRLLEKLYDKELNGKLDTFAMDNASWAGQDALNSFGNYISKKGVEVSYQSGAEDLNNWATLEFKR